jgi:energy-coupling factor transport system ATP-binding protein
MDQGEIVFQGHPSDIKTRREILIKHGILLPDRKPIKPLKNSGKPLVKVKDLSCRAGKTRILENISFQLNKGEIVGLMGDNGSGKTTLSLHLMKFKEPEEGTLIFNGSNIKDQSTSRLARDIGFVFQNPSHQIFEDSVDSEILFGPKNAGMNLDSLNKRKRELVKTLGLEPLLDRSPFSLSYGQKRRLNIASVLISDPKLAILDEVFIGQDMHNVDLVMQTLGSAARRGMTILLIVHDPNIAARFCHRILFLKDRKLIIDEPVDVAFHEIERIGEKAYLPIDREGSN